MESSIEDSTICNFVLDFLRSGSYFEFERLSAFIPVRITLMNSRHELTSKYAIVKG